MLLLPEGQTGEAWKSPKNIAFFFGNLGEMDKKFTVYQRAMYEFTMAVNVRIIIYVHLLVCYLNKLQNARCKDKNAYYYYYYYYYYYSLM